MKYTLLLLIAFCIMSCGERNQKFEPIESPANLSEKQKDSILTKFNFQYENPILIDSTNQLIIPVSTELLDRRKKFSNRGHSSKDFPRYWNVFFYNKLTGDQRLLTKSKISISRINANRAKNESQMMKTKIFYEITEVDYNQDGKLNNKDPEYLFSSDIDGQNLSQISPDKENLEYYNVMPNSNQILLRTSRDSNRDLRFNGEDEPILYKAELVENKWKLNEIIDPDIRIEIEDLYFKQWLTKNK